MKRGNLLSRFLSAVLVLLSFTISSAFGAEYRSDFTISGNVEQTHPLENDLIIRNYRAGTYDTNLITITVPAAGTVTLDPNDNDFYKAVAGATRWMAYDNQANPNALTVARGGTVFNGPVTYTLDRAGTVFIYIVNNNTNNQSATLKAGKAFIKFSPTNPDTPTPVDPTNNVCKAVADKNIGIDDGVLYSPITYTLDGITKYSNGKYSGFYGMIEAESAGTVSIETDGNCKASIELASPNATNCEAGAIVSRTVSEGQKFYIRVSPKDNAENGVGKKCEVNVNFTPADSDKPICRSFDDTTLGLQGNTLRDEITYTANGVVRYSNGRYTGFWGAINVVSDGTVVAENCSQAVNISIDTQARQNTCIASVQKSQEVTAGNTVYVHISPSDDVNDNYSVNPSCTVKFIPKDGGGTGGGTGGGDTPIVIENPNAPSDDFGDSDIPNSGQFFKDFTGIDDYLNQKTEKFYGGNGKYIYGDYAVAGSSVLDYDKTTTNASMTDSKATYREIDSFTLNGSSDTIILPNGVTKDDIDHVRIFWQGHIFDTKSITSGKNASKGYKSIELKINDKAKNVVSADSGNKTGKCDGFVIGNSSHSNVKYRLKYACTQDITELVKQQVEDGYMNNITFSVGNIKTSNGIDTGGASANNGKVDYTGMTVTGAYGGWGVVVVYNKDFDRQEDFKNDLILGKVTGESSKTDVEADDYIQTYFKPKSVSIYGHSITITPWDGFSPMEVSGKVDGFYTPQYGKVQGKLSFLGFAADTPLSYGEYFKVQDFKKDNEGKTMSLLDNSLNPKKTNDVSAVFNSTITKLKPGTYEEDNTGNSGNSAFGFDLDEFDMSNFLGNKQTSLRFSLGGTMTCGTYTSPRGQETNNGNCGGSARFANQNFISMIAISIDLYTPDLCYLDYIFDSAGWLKFFNEKGDREDVNPEDVIPDVRDSGGVVAGEQLFYKVKFENRSDENGGGEDAYGASVKIEFGEFNNYVSNSSTIDNRLEADHIKDAKFVYLKDNEPGTYPTYQDLYNGTSIQDKNKQYNTYRKRELTFYIGKDAGIPSPSGDPAGGLFKLNDKAYVEFNATVGRTYIYKPLQYTATYSMKLTDSDETFPGPKTKMKRCADPKPEMSIHVLNGLKITNQNYKDLKDKNKTTSQDDRLFTQIAELPFDVNMIFKPDIKEIFGEYCEERDSNQNCIKYEEKLCTSYDNIFMMKENKCIFRTKKDQSGEFTDELVDDIQKINGDLQFFELSGNLYLSAIRGNLKGACRYIDDTNKIPFGISKAKDKINNPTRYMTDYLLKFQEYQNKDGEPKRKVMPIENMYLEDAFDGVTFMISYYPRGLQTPDTNTSKIADDLDVTGESDMSYSEYFINETRETLLVKAFSRYGYKKDLSSDDKAKKLAEIKEKYPNEYNIAMYGEDGIADGKDNGIEDEIIRIKKNVDLAKSYFGIDMSADGSFHVCESDIFVVRPSYFDIELNNLDKYGKLVNTTEKGDITKVKDTDIKHKENLRIGGDYTENTDILHGLLYAKSNEGNAVPNYYTVIGGDLGESRYTIRNGFGDDSLQTAESNATLLKAIRDAAVREEKTYLKPFISNDCYENISLQSYYVDRDINKQENKLLKEDKCSTEPVKYCGIDVNNTTGVYGIKWSDNKLDTSDKNCDQIGDLGRDKFGKPYYDKKDFTGCGVSFEKKYFRAWDKTGTSLWVDFGVYSVNGDLKEKGYTSINHYTPKQILQETLKEPSAKSLKSAVLYTGTLYENKELKGKIFNYYNVGDVMIKIHDNTWTDRYGNQTFNSTKDYNNEYWGTTCIINSTRNTPITQKDVQNSQGKLSKTDIGKIGCDVAVKDDKNLVLRYQPDRVSLSIEGLGSNGETDINGNRFVYFNQPDIFGTDKDGNTNKSMISVLDQQGMIKFHGQAFLSDKVYKDAIASLYDGSVIEGEYNDEIYEVARCGFANDMNVTLDFNFDCSKDESDSRCIKSKDPKETDNDINYAPFIGFDFNYTIPKGTQYLSETECRNQSGSDSRCFMFNKKDATIDKVGNVLNFNEYKNTSNTLPMNLAINYYTNINRENGFINNYNTDTGFIDPKNPFFKLLARAFENGETNQAIIYVNFDRMQKRPHLPLYLFATDFEINALSNSGKIEPAKFNAQGVLLNIKEEELISTSTPSANTNEKKENLVKFTNLPYNDNDRYENIDITRLNLTKMTFEEYIQANILAGTNAADFISSRGVDPYILFVYGKANEYNDGDRIVLVPGSAQRVTYFSRSTNPINVPILDSIYCDRIDNCVGIPNIIVNNGTSDENLKPSATIFTDLSRNKVRPNSKHFITNTLTATLNATSVRNWVGSYNPETTGKIKLISENGRNRTSGSERLQISAIDPANDTGVIRVRVNTYPWLIYTPHIDAVYTETIAARYNRITPILYYNYFDVAFRNTAGDWGGEGEVKNAEKEGDIGSFISGKDFKDIAGSNKASEGSNYRQERIDW